MRWWRASALSRFVALVILVWTVADLSSASLCALDNEDGAPFAAAPIGVGGVILDGATSQTPHPASVHVDDCFCCSHCVEVAAIVPANIAGMAKSHKPPLTLLVPRIFGSPLYHPPQFSLQ